MEITIRQLRKVDFEKARKFAVEGMHLNWYASSKVELFFTVNTFGIKRYPEQPAHWVLIWEIG
ncbi:hypothetical protein QYF52_25465 [Paenibacillus polymyxa]|uniref:hypothetical protein n=1 Tax=Paenibacillus polymyxa TaxID=1406 RepID=UPI0025B6BD1E|nr:hypothetical protein [Paenibacillus polymyxa]MDN4081277.1 hypothetical protein [Paenibacillus polymyxa]MDN4106980.1 hypothetical protein [Paenibacillus polymyxa]MDN4116934.1 hypothetical protein [Paenibacillus polymyxa]